MVTGAGRDGQRERESHRSWIFFQLELHQTWIACPPGVSSAGTSEDNLLPRQLPLFHGNYPCPKAKVQRHAGSPTKEG
jgi:hypothetical protein